MIFAHLDFNEEWKIQSILKWNLMGAETILLKRNKRLRVDFSYVFKETAWTVKRKVLLS